MLKPLTFLKAYIAVPNLKIHKINSFQSVNFNAIALNATEEKAHRATEIQMLEFKAKEQESWLI